ncbi:MAG TPA: DegV family protein [Acidimicrobiales bacterium]|nr:DegV family protein [Acidimicrobiales bacterium]
MPPVGIVTDSACDLTAALAEEAGVSVVPLTIRFGEEELLDRRDLSPAAFWARCRTATALPETAAPAPGSFRQAYDEAADRGCEGVLCLTISAGVSATYQSARAAADSFDRVPVEVIDTRTLTMGQGLLVLAAAEAAAVGEELAQLAARTREAMGRTRVFGVVDTLDHLQRGGRIGGAKALLGSLLSIKPVVQVKDGVVAEESKQRTRARSLDYLARKVRADAPLERLAVVDGAAPDIGDFLARLEGVEVAHPLVVTDLGPVVGTHAGPGTIGACYQVAVR